MNEFLVHVLMFVAYLFFTIGLIDFRLIASVMSERIVKQTKKSLNGNILALCNHGELWSPKWKSEAIYEIENNIHSYYVALDDRKIEIKVINGSGEKYIRTDPDKTFKNNLDDLPDC